MSTKNRIHREERPQSFLSGLSSLFWDVPGKRHAFTTPVLVIYLLIILWYSYLLLSPYYGRPVPSDFLTYTRMAAADSPELLNRVGCERLTALLPIRLLALITKSPAESGMVVLISVLLLLVLCSIFFCHRLGGPMAGILAGCLLTSTTSVMINTELHVDQFSALFLVLPLLLAMESVGRSSRVKYILCFLVGVSLALQTGSKPNFLVFIPLFAFPLLIGRQWKMLFYLSAGVFGGVLLLGGMLIILYPKNIWFQYFKFLSASYSVYNTPLKSAYPVYWFQHFLLPERYVIPLYVIALFQKSYRFPGVRESFAAGGWHLLSLLVLSAINSRLELSPVYSYCLVVPLVIGASLVIAGRINVKVKRGKSLLLLGCFVLLVFMLGAYIGITFSDKISNVAEETLPAIMYMFTPLLGIALVAWLISFKGGRLAAVFTILFFAIPQTALINALTYQRTVKNVHQWNKQYYSFTDTIKSEYLREQPVLIYTHYPLESFSDDFFGWRCKLILSNRQYPLVKVDMVSGDEILLDYQLMYVSAYKSIITDSPEVIRRRCQGGYIKKIERTEIEGLDSLHYFSGVKSCSPVPLIKNGDFSDGTERWDAGNNAYITTSADGEEGNCLSIQENGMSDPFAYQKLNIKLGVRHKASFYVKGSYGARWRAGIEDVGGNNVIFFNDNKIGQEATDSWGKHEIVFKATSSRVLIFLQHLAGAGQGTTIYFDSIKLVATTPQ